MTNKLQLSASPRLFVALALVALNLAIGGLVAAFRLPIYLDSLGIVLSTILLGWRLGLVTAVLTVVLGFLAINPYFPAYICTSFGIVAATATLYARGMFDTVLRAALSGIVIAVVAAVLSAPVTAYLGGNTMSGVDAVTAFLLASGRSMMDAVLISGLTSEPVDKTLVCVLAHVIVTRLPRRVIERAGLRPLPVRP